MAKRLRKWLKRITIGFFALILLLLVVTSSTFDLMIHYGRYRDVIKQAEALTAKTKETVYFRTEWNPSISGYTGANNICAKRLEDGTLFVRILVRDLHRLGKSGLVFTEHDGGYIERDLDSHGCGEWTSKGRIWGSWWAIKNNLG